jgi:hypothetical protein
MQLEIRVGAEAGRVVPLSKSVTIGRDQSCDLVLDDADVSRRHAYLDPRPDGRVDLQDLGSRNGSYVNGRRVDLFVLKGGEQLRFGSTVLMASLDQTVVGNSGVQRAAEYDDTKATVVPLPPTAPTPPPSPVRPPASPAAAPLRDRKRLPAPQTVRRGRPRRGVLVAVGIGALLGVALVASQLFLPGYAENRTADRLTSNGGNADVSISAFPALRLIAKHGDRLAIDARDVRLDPNQGQSRVLEDLDRFEEVDVELTDSFAPPIEISKASLRRRKERKTYSFRLDGKASGASLLDYTQGGASSALSEIEGLAGSITGISTAISIDLDAVLESDDGRPRIVSGAGTIGGFPASLFVQMISSALTARL